MNKEKIIALKTLFTACTLILFLCYFNEIKSQSFSHHPSESQLKSINSVLFGKDILINNNSNEDQRNVVICSAFNGWLYASYSYINTYYNFGALSLLRSVDNGNTWTAFWNTYYPLDNSKFTSLDIVACGDSASNIKVFLAAIITTNDDTIGNGYMFIIRYNGNTGAFEKQMLTELSAYSVSLANDFNFPAINSNPYSLGVIFSKCTFNHNDSIIFCTSNNGGQSFNNREVVATSDKRFHKVALTYGRSPSFSTGRYFAVWEEKAGHHSKTGHIYTAHTDPNFDSPFSNPKMIDSLDVSMYNNVNNPVIACQYNNTDNDSSNITEVILFEKYISSQNRIDIEGVYNMRPTITNHFEEFILNSSSDFRKQPSINFNPFDGSFMTTFYDSTMQKLPFLTHNFNMINPDDWQIVSPGYNDSTNLANPVPKVILNFSQQQGVNVWTGEGIIGHGVALFDAPYIPSGIFGNSTSDYNDFSVYPNPCNILLTADFELHEDENVNITLYNVVGKQIGILTDQSYAVGRHKLYYNVSLYSSGSYLLTFKAGNYTKSCKVFIVR